MACSCSGNCSGAWLVRMHCGVNAESRRSWRDSGSMSAPGLWRNTCDNPTAVHRHPGGDDSLGNTPRISGHAISSLCTRFGFERCMSTLSSAERWVRTVRTECLDHIFIFGHRQLTRTLSEYIACYNRWRPHRSLGQKAPCMETVKPEVWVNERVFAEPVLGGLHHVYRYAA